MSELDLLRLIRSRVPPLGPGIVLGIGDDCAIFRPRGSREDLVFTTDMVLEDVHFRRQTHPGEIVGWRALARGLSDIAAMGAQPRFCLVSLALAPWADDAWVDAFYRGLTRLARMTGTTVAGGDLARAEKLACDVAVCGSVPRGKALRRDGARPGDAIYVSGRLGGAALGLETRSGAAWNKHATPEPRLSLGVFVRERLRATAALDLSDGLSLDLHRLCLASGAGAEIAGRDMPVFAGATIEQALHGGEDYELLFTLRPRAKVPELYEGLRLTRIGVITEGTPGLVLLDGRPLEAGGYDHFRSR
jgi:thiamine-monophosphate kinase